MLLPLLRLPLLRLALLALLPSSILAAQSAPKPVVMTYIRAGHLFDAASGKFQDNVTLVVADGRVKSIETAAFKLPAGATVVDLSKDYVLPGLIDCHTHLGARADRYEEIDSFLDTPFDSAIAGVVNAKKTLDAGFTSVRDVGSLPFLAVDLRNNINSGYIPGPRIVASGPILSITGGHGDLNNYAPQVRYTMFPDKRDFGIADGPEELRKTIREQIKYGVDVIKIAASGGVLLERRPARSPRSTPSKSSR